MLTPKSTPVPAALLRQSASCRSILSQYLGRSSTPTQAVRCGAWRALSTASSTGSAAEKALTHEQMRMLIVGCPGSGKGTLSSRLLKKYEMKALSAGDVLRSHIQRQTDIGKQAAKVIEQGSLMPDDIMMKLIGAEVESIADVDWLLDGFPRTLGQAKMLDDALSKSGKELNLVVNLDVPEDIILQRIIDRWTHIPSGRIYNLSYNPPQVEGKDDVTGEPLEKRADDNPDIFAKRLQSFHNSTGPMLDYYSSQQGSASAPSLYVNLKGSTSDEIWPKLCAVVEERYPSLVAKVIAQ